MTIGVIIKLFCSQFFESIESNVMPIVINLWTGSIPEFHGKQVSVFSFYTQVGFDGSSLFPAQSPLV